MPMSGCGVNANYIGSFGRISGWVNGQNNQQTEAQRQVLTRTELNTFINAYADYSPNWLESLFVGVGITTGSHLENATFMRDNFDAFDQNGNGGISQAEVTSWEEKNDCR